MGKIAVLVNDCIDVSLSISSPSGTVSVVFTICIVITSQQPSWTVLCYKNRFYIDLQPRGTVPVTLDILYIEDIG